MNRLPSGCGVKRISRGAALLLLLLAARPSLAAEPAAQTADTWHIVETANLRILCYGRQPVSSELADECEQLRNTLCERWLGCDSERTWQPKCDIVLHSTDAGYLREVGAGAGATVASSLIDQKQGRVALRRVDIRATRPNWLVSALPHELTHVVLADRFVGQRLPRWIDEGVAILADPASKQAGHTRDLQNALAGRSAFRVMELIGLDDYPPAQRWGTFYGQSASLVKFLVEERSPDDFVKFAHLAIEEGYEASLRKVYGFNGVADLERRWRSKLSGAPRQTSEAIVSRARHAASPVKNVPVGLVRNHSVAAESE